MISSTCGCSATKLCLILCNPMDWGMPGFPVLHYLPEYAQIHVHWVGDAIQPSQPLPLSSLFAFNLSQLQDLFVSQFFTSGDQSTGVSASASVLPMNIQDWFPRVLTGLISLMSTVLSRAFSNTTVQKPQFFSAQPLWFDSHIRTWLLRKS